MSWEAKPLDDLCYIVGGGTPSKKIERYYGGDIPWATVGDMNVETLVNTGLSITSEGLQNSSSKLIPTGNVIIATRVGLGKSCILGVDTAINQDLKGLIPKKANTVDEKFLFRWTQRIAPTIIGAGTGATVQGVKLSFISQLPLPIPPLEEQKRIVEILDEAFAAIDQAKANIERNLTNAKELFQSKLNEVFSNPGEDWEVKSLSEICQICGGSSLKNELLVNDGDIAYFKVSDLNHKSNQTHLTVSNLHTTLTAIKRVLPKGSIVFPKRGGAIATNKKRIASIPFWMDTNLMALVPHDSVTTDFLYYFISSLDLREITSGSSIPQINKYSFDGISLPHPPLEEQVKLAEQLHQIQGFTAFLSAAYLNKLQGLEELRQSILEQAFEGKLTESAVA